MNTHHQYQSFSRPLFYIIFVLSIIIWILTLIMLILEIAFSMVGFNNGIAIATACDPFTETYYYIKYNTNLSTIVGFCFIFSVLAFIFSTVLTVILLILLIKLNKDEVIAFRKVVKVVLYVFASLVVLAATVPAGYYLSFATQLPHCAITVYDASQIKGIAAIGIIAVILGFVLWLLLWIFFYQRVSSQQKYKEVSSNHTEPQEKVYKYQEQKPKKQPQIYTSPQKEQPRREVYRHEETQQNLYESPSKRKINNYSYSKQPEHNQRKNYSILESKGPLVTEQKKYTPERSYQQQSQNQRHVLQRKNPTVRKDEQAYKEYENQYLRNRGMGSILPTSGVEQRQYKGSDYFRSVGQPPRRFSPSKKSDKQGVLVSYIRGKYAN